MTIARDEFGRETGGQNAAASYACQLSDSGVATNETVTIGGREFELRREIDDNGRVVALAVTSLVQRIAYAADGKIVTISNADAVAACAYAMAGRDVGSTLALANGSTFVRTLTRDPYRRDLITAVDNSIGADFACSYDAASQLIRRNDDTFAYNSRSEVIRWKWSVLWTGRETWTGRMQYQHCKTFFIAKFPSLRCTCGHLANL